MSTYSFTHAVYIYLMSILVSSPQFPGQPALSTDAYVTARSKKEDNDNVLAFEIVVINILASCKRDHATPF